MTGHKHRIALLIFLFFILVYFLTAKGNIEVSDTSFSVKTAKAIIESRSLSIGTTDKKGPGIADGGYYYITKDGRTYSIYGIGLAIIFVPYVLLGKAVSLLTGLSEETIVSFLISFYNVLFGAGACALFFYIVRCFKTSNRVSAVMAVLLGLGTICWRYSVWDFSEATQMFFLTLSIYCVLKNNEKSLILCSCAYGYLILLKAVYVVYIPVVLLYLLHRNMHNKKLCFKRSFLFLSFVSLSIFGLLLLNYLRFGSIFEFGYGKYAKAFYPIELIKNAPNLLFSLNKGLLVYNPVILLGIFGYFRFFKLYPEETIFFLSLVILNIAVSSMWYAWGGGWSWGPRFLVPCIPLWLIPSYIPISKNGVFKKTILVSLIFVSVLIQVMSVLQKDHEYHQIRYNLVAKHYRKDMPPDILGSAILLKHKILIRDNMYSLSEFGIKKDGIIDTSEFETYRGLNLWYCHLARYYNRPAIRWIFILFLPFVIIIFRMLLLKVRSNTGDA